MYKNIQVQNKETILTSISTEEKVHIFANLLIDRFLQDQSNNILIKPPETENK